MLDQRVIYNALEISAKINDFRAGTQAFAYVAPGKLYIGSLMPFNNLWFEMGTANVNTTALSVDIWFGDQWVSAVDIDDQTNGLKQTERISWNVERLKGWDIEQQAADVSGLSGFNIYDKYWARLSWSADMSAGTTIKYIGQKFSTDAILYSHYPDLQQSDLLTSFANGKTSWDEQHYMAAEYIVSDLRKRGLVISRSQIMDWTLFEEASCHRVACIAYTAFGRPYFDQLQEARKQYKEAMNMKYFSVDSSGDGSLQPAERTVSTSFMKR